MAIQVVGSDFPSLASDQAGVNPPDRHDLERKASRKTFPSDSQRVDDQHGQNGPQPSWTTVGHQPSRGINIDPPKGDAALDAVRASGIALGGKAAPENSIAKLSEQNRAGKNASPVNRDTKPANSSSSRSAGVPEVPAKLAAK